MRPTLERSRAACSSIGLAALFGCLMLATAASAQPPEQPTRPQPPPQQQAQPAEQAEPSTAEGTEESPSRSVEQSPAGQPRYLEAIRRELEAMRVRGAECQTTDAQRGRCTFNARGISTGRDFTVHAVYSDVTDTVYLYVERYLVVPADGPTTNAVLRRLMELNWSFLLGKLEWDSTDGEVRLAMVLNTDSNFDRRAFRSAVRGIGQLADRYWGELDRILRGQTSAP